MFPRKKACRVRCRRHQKCKGISRIYLSTQVNFEHSNEHSSLPSDKGFMICTFKINLQWQHDIKEPIALLSSAYLVMKHCIKCWQFLLLKFSNIKCKVSVPAHSKVWPLPPWGSPIHFLVGSGVLQLNRAVLGCPWTTGCKELRDWICKENIVNMIS